MEPREVRLDAAKAAVGVSCRLEPSCTREVLAAGSFVEKLTEKTTQKQKRQGRHQAATQCKAKRRCKAGQADRASSSTEDFFCSGCGQSYYQDTEEEKEGWIGCDSSSCSRWFHYWCAELDDMPEASDFWSCPICLDS